MKKFRLATSKDCDVIKQMVNKMYGIEYEVRDNLDIAGAIKNKTEIYVLAYDNDKCIGFSGASLNNDYYKDIITPDIAVIDYIYTLEDSRDVSVSFELISGLLKQLVDMGVKQAIMQVQTFNKQRFFHYALSDKNIIKANTLERNGQSYDDQILLIEDLNKVANMTIRQLMIKAHKYTIEEN